MACPPRAAAKPRIPACRATRLNVLWVLLFEGTRHGRRADRSDRDGARQRSIERAINTASGCSLQMTSRRNGPRCRPWTETRAPRVVNSPRRAIHGRAKRVALLNHQ